MISFLRVFPQPKYIPADKYPSFCAHTRRQPPDNGPGLREASRRKHSGRRGAPLQRPLQPRLECLLLGRGDQRLAPRRGLLSCPFYFLFSFICLFKYSREGWWGWRRWERENMIDGDYTITCKFPNKQEEYKEGPFRMDVKNSIKIEHGELRNEMRRKMMDCGKNIETKRGRLY